MRKKICFIIIFAVYIFSLQAVIVSASTPSEDSAAALREILLEQRSSYLKEAADAGEYELTKYFGHSLEDVTKDFPDLTEDFCYRYYTVYTSESTGVQFYAIDSAVQDYDELIFKVCAAGNECRYLIHGLSPAWDDTKLTDYAKENQWSGPGAGNGFFWDCKTSEGDMIVWSQRGDDQGPLFLECEWNPDVYKASPQIVTESKDLAGYIGKTLQEAMNSFPELTIEQKDGSVWGILEGAKLQIEGNADRPEEARIECAYLDRERPSDYCIYGIGIDTDPERAEEILNSIGLFYDGGSGEYSDAEGNVFYSYEPAIYSSDIVRGEQ